MQRKWIRRSLTVIAVVLIALVTGFVIWAGTPAGSLMESVDVALESGGGITVSSEPWLTFTPDEPTDTGFIFYPGGRVLAEAYAPVLRDIAEAGYLVVAPAMPLNLAVLAPDIADEITAAYPDIEIWVIGGHSLGGAMAAGYARWHPDIVDGLVLWAAYPQDSDSLAGMDIAVASVYGTRDGLATSDKIAYSRVNLPEDAEFVAIEGGNHAQFGDYGAQSGDNPADISRAAQQEQTVAATLAVLEAVSSTP